MSYLHDGNICLQLTTDVKNWTFSIGPKDVFGLHVVWNFSSLRNIIGKISSWFFFFPFIYIDPFVSLSWLLTCFLHCKFCNLKLFYLFICLMDCFFLLFDYQPHIWCFIPNVYNSTSFKVSIQYLLNKWTHTWMC